MFWINICFIYLHDLTNQNTQMILFFWFHTFKTAEGKDVHIFIYSQEIMTLNIVQRLIQCLITFFFELYILDKWLANHSTETSELLITRLIRTFRIPLSLSYNGFANDKFVVIFDLKAVLLSYVRVQQRLPRNPKTIF